MKKALRKIIVMAFMICAIACDRQNNYVDLGLPSGTLWATCNLGAEQPHETGLYLAWGETEEKDIYNLDTYFDKEYKLFNTYEPGKGCMSGTEYDAATILWGTKWAMPTHEQAWELYQLCKWEITKDYNGTGVAGAICTGPNGNHIFFPANGLIMNDTQQYHSSGNYWTGSLIHYNEIDWVNFIDFNENGLVFNWMVSRDHRFWGRNIRPVRQE